MTVKPEQATAADDKAAAAKADARPKTADVVRQVREGRAPVESAQTPERKAAAAANAADVKPDAKDGIDKPDEGGAKGGSAEFYSDDELAAFPSLVNVDMKKVRPELRNTVTRMQTAERKRLQRLDAAIAETERGRQAPAKAQPEEKEDLPFTDDEFDAMLRSKKGRAKMLEVLKEEGADISDLRELSEDRTMNKALNLAAAKYPELAKDQTFWQETVQAIADDDDLTERFNKATRNSRELAGIFREAAANVRASRADADKEKVAKDRADLDKEKENVKRQRETDNAKPGSVAAKAGKKAGVNADSPMATKDVIKMIRSQRGYA